VVELNASVQYRLVQKHFTSTIGTLVVVGLNYFNIIKVKNKNMNLSIKELNELIYSLGIAYHNGNFVNKDLNESLLEKLYSELNSKIAEEAIDEEVDEPEFDSAGFSVRDREPNQSELDTIQRWLKNGDDYEDWNWDGNVLTIYNSNGGVEEYTYQDLVDVGVFDNINSHFVTNEEADEDYRSTLQQDSDRYESSVSKDYDNHLKNIRERGYITQALLDYVDRKGAVSHGELETYYKQLTGSNSFSHILQSLRTPYKNRKTQRYIAKEGKRYTDAKYIIKVANPTNWIIVND
jgi:hypothetical protein